MSEKELTVRSVVGDWLQAHGYDGLYREGCGCELGDLMPCDEPGPDCKAGYKWPCTCGKPREHECDFYICSTRPPTETDECPVGLREKEAADAS